VPPDPCDRTEYQPGELAQWDLWFPPTSVPLEDGSLAKPPVLVGVSGYSRVMVAEMIPSREAPRHPLGSSSLPAEPRWGSSQGGL